jgi:hypothetical protein
MELLVVMLLASLSTVLGILGIFLFLYRRERRRNGSSLFVGALESPELLSRPFRRSLPFPVPDQWLAIRGASPARIREALRGRVTAHSNWAEALVRSRERALFVSPPVDGWTLVIGAGIPDVFHDVDRAFHFLREVSESLGTVHFFAANRVLHSHAWARLEDGRVTRAYAWAGMTLWNEGRTTLEERLLGLRCRDYAEEAEPLRYGELPSECRNTDRLVLLARRWGIDPIVASELIVHHESALEREGRRNESDAGLGT